jgi:hypothetical protein
MQLRTQIRDLQRRLRLGATLRATDGGSRSPETTGD